MSRSACRNLPAGTVGVAPLSKAAVVLSRGPCEPALACPLGSIPGALRPQVLAVLFAGCRWNLGRMAPAAAIAGCAGLEIAGSVFVEDPWTGSVLRVEAAAPLPCEPNRLPTRLPMPAELPAEATCTREAALDSVEASTQGNRVNKSCGDEACEEIVIPCGDFSLKAQGIFAWGLSDQIVGHVLESGEVGRGMICADATFVVAEDHVHHPM